VHLREGVHVTWNGRRQPTGRVVEQQLGQRDGLVAQPGYIAVFGN
jgi:hypothetical protein